MNETTVSIDQLVKQLQKQELPPVHLWNPSFKGSIDMRIAHDGSWLYQGSRIERTAMVRLFSRVLRKERNDYYLVTPQEKLKIIVDDAPFIATELEVVVEEGMQFLIFTTNVGDQVIAGKRHQLFVRHDDSTGEPSPYIHVRNNLNAKLSRPVFYQLADHCAEQDEHYVVASNDCSFQIGPRELS